MLKKINVQNARLGMFVHDVCGNWMDHPFWKTAFKLDKAKDLNALLESGLQEVWIDTEKGLDVEMATSEANEVPVANVEKAAEASILPQTAAPAKKSERRVALHDEILLAKKLHAKSSKTVALLFKEAHKKGTLPIEESAILVEEITQSVSRNSGALLSLAQLKDKHDYTYQHSVAVCALMVALGKQLGMEGEILRCVGMAGLLHDIGTVAIPNEILNKPGRLTEEEFNIVKTHTRRGWEILSSSHDMDDMVLDVCLHHHEWVNGSGYPENLSGDDLTLFSRMAAICDVYDAMTSDRCYKKAITPASAIRKMIELQHGHFDQTVYRAFVKTVGIYPTGTMVKLKSGRLAVVMDQTTKSLTTPIVKVFFSTKTNEPVFLKLVDLSVTPDPIVSVEDSAKWKFCLKTMAGI